MHYIEQLSKRINCSFLCSFRANYLLFEGGNLMDYEKFKEQFAEDVLYSTKKPSA